MKIATLLNVHEDNPTVRDTLESIRTYMTDDILILTDGASHYKSRYVRGGGEILVRHNPFEDLPADRVEGFYHDFWKSPFRNMTLGLKTLFENYRADWYCYIEYDCLVCDDSFKEDLELFNTMNVWLAANDLRQGNYRLPIVESIVGKIKECHIVLGCCVFFHKNYLATLHRHDFFTRFLHLTNGFKETVPGFDEQGAHDIGEVIYPTLAAHFGGRTQEFARCNDMVGWSGNAERYPMRFRPEIDQEFPDASIMHPLKTYDHPARVYNRERRKRQNQWKSRTA